ncbi:MFS general substrate transporter [Coniochaeta ligniaria NRRL 30616]|uniref:MFS general substrate transporter n=1 Tax=Coniochaeta ligniaria NRRL 30616 TaxID=1408157 RepID=A0A1J7JLD1_9PEZI|nr:MFS general substrate transporter [Coniochaeta ligniaria NRRL 30616]
MGHCEAINTDTGADISAASVPEEPDLKLKSEKDQDVEIGVVTATEERSSGDEKGQNEVVNAEEQDELPPAKAKKSLSFKLAFIGLAASIFVFQVDATCLGIALPTIAGDLHGTTLQSFWANLSYTLCSLVTQPVWAAVSNAFGRKPPLYASMALFSAGSIVFATAGSMRAIIAGRVLQGLGGGGLDILVEVILTDMTALDERATYLGLMAVPNAVGNIMGPAVGALFSTYATWRWIGWINLPLLGAGAVLVFFFLKLRPVPLDAGLGANLARLDWVGMALVVVGITILVLPISWAGSLFPWASWQTLLPLLCGVAVLALFVLYESRPANPIIPHRLFHSKTGNVTLAGGFIHGVILVSLLQYLPLLYQAVELESPIASAVSLLPTVIVSVVVAAASMMMVPLFGGYVWLLRLSWVILTLGTGLLALFDVSSSPSLRYGLPVLWGQGVALLRLNLLPMQASVKNVDDVGQAIAVFFTLRLFGGLVGLTVSAAVFTNVFATAIADAGVPLTGALEPLGQAANAVNFIGRLRGLGGVVTGETLGAVLGVYLRCFRMIFYVMTGMGAVGLVSSLGMEEIGLVGGERGGQRFEE